MNSEELQHYDYLAATRLSHVGYRRYLRFKIQALTHQQVQNARNNIREFIEKWEAREYRIAHMINCAPLYKALQ